MNSIGAASKPRDETLDVPSSERDRSHALWQARSSAPTSVEARGGGRLIVFRVQLRAWDARTTMVARWLTWSAVMFPFCVACVVFSSPPLLRTFLTPLRHNKDYDLWLEVGRKVLAGQDLYLHAPGEGLRYMYPPFAAVLFMAPIAAFGPKCVVCAVVLLNLLAWTASIVLSVRLVRGSVRGAPPGDFAIPAAITAPYVWDNFLLGQPNVVLLAIMLAGLNLLASRRALWAGACFALATAVKAFPVLMLPYLLYRRRWIASFSMLLTLGVLLVLAPAPFRGFDRNLSEIGVWAQCMLEPSGDRLGAGGAAMGWGNQSLFGLVHRLLRPLPLRDAHGDPFTINIASLPPEAAQAVVAVMAVATTAVFLWWTARRRTPTRLEAAVEGAVLLVLLLLFCPVSRTYMFCWLMPAVSAWLRMATDRRSPPEERAKLVLGGLAAFGLLATALSQGFTAVPQAIGVTALGALLLSAMLLRSVRAGARPAEVQA